MERPIEYKKRLAERIVSHVEPWYLEDHEEENEENTLKAIDEDPCSIIEWLLDLLDNATC